MEYGHPNSRSLRFVTLAIVLFFITSTAVAQDHIAAVDAFLKAEMQEQKIPGVSLAVVNDGKPRRHPLPLSTNRVCGVDPFRRGGGEQGREDQRVRAAAGLKEV